MLPPPLPGSFSMSSHQFRCRDALRTTIARMNMTTHHLAAILTCYLLITYVFAWPTHRAARHRTAVRGATRTTRQSGSSPWRRAHTAQDPVRNAASKGEQSMGLPVSQSSHFSGVTHALQTPNLKAHKHGRNPVLCNTSHVRGIHIDAKKQLLKSLV
jgi:hypothetical protein